MASLQRKRSLFDSSDEDEEPQKSTSKGKTAKTRGGSSVVRKMSGKSSKQTQHKTSMKNNKECNKGAKLKTSGEHSKQAQLKTTVENSTGHEEVVEVQASGDDKEAQLKTPEKSSTIPDQAKIELSPAQRARIEQNRQKALLIKQEKANKRLSPQKKEDSKQKVLHIDNVKLIDTGGGFFIEENDTPDADMEAAMKLVDEPAPLFEEDRPFCEECNQPFNNSFLFHNFDHPVCDQCRDDRDKHMLITRTDSKTEYLLKDVDFDQREPILKFVTRRNPHNPRWGDMKLYLKLQVEKRALGVWGSEEALEEALEKKEDQREKTKKKKYEKQLKELRMNVRSSLYTRSNKVHEHEYGEEEYLEEEDEYCKTCISCGHQLNYRR
ncbi:DNA repair protein complementing XP-A cells homolog Xpac isoform X2 [Oratosquilla oratoria]|uniref:DNA repair protein complementing XP-A cells homolog Xpac isoform X2 n=1 Tax=Oratosquilla oratoria TaxID=337810 RepID=UPI003F76BC4B